MLPIAKVEANAAQPRKQFDADGIDALADSIATHGILQPITVRRLDSATTRSSPASAAGGPPGRPV